MRNDTARPHSERDRLVTERSRHIYDYADSRNVRSTEPPIGICGRRIKTGDFVAGLHMPVYLQMRRHPSFEVFKGKVALARDLCPACERLVPARIAQAA